MKSNLLKALLLSALITITVVSFMPRSRVRRATPPPPPVPPAHEAAEVEKPEPPPAPWAEKWGRYAYEGEQFSVEMPAMPLAHESSRSVGPAGNAEPVRTFGLYSDGVVLLVTSFASPGGAEPPVYFAAYHWDRVVFADAGEVKTDALRGREYVSSVDYYRRSRVFFVQNRAYLVSAMSLKPDDPRALHFLDSLELGVGPEAVEVREPPPSGVAPVELPAAEGGGLGSGVKVERGPGEPYYIDEVSREAMFAFRPREFEGEPRAGEVAAVRLRAVLTAEGKVGNVTVIGGMRRRDLRERAADSARHILFFPAVREGRAVSQYVTLDYKVRLDSLL